MQATVAGHHPCPVQWEPSLILLPRDLRCKAGAAISMRDGSSPEAYLCDQVRRSWPASIKEVRESRRRYRENPREMRGGRKPGVSPVAIGAITARMILLMAVVPAGTWRGEPGAADWPAPPGGPLPGQRAPPTLTGCGGSPAPSAATSGLRKAHAPGDQPCHGLDSSAARERGRRRGGGRAGQGQLAQPGRMNELAPAV